MSDLNDELERLQRENEELRKNYKDAIGGTKRDLINQLAQQRRKVSGLKQQIAALKAQSTEPVATIRTWHKDGDLHAELTDWEDGIDDLPDGEHTLYTTPPTAAALVEDFKRRAVEVCAALNAGYSIPFEAVTQCAELIESLPLEERSEMTTQHTPGPWKAHFEEAYFVTGPDLGRVALMLHLKGAHGLGGRRSGDESAANCRLIAAAPDLLAALRDAVRVLGNDTPASVWAAIAKAKGEKK